MKARHPLPLHPDMDCGFTAWTPSGVKREKHRAYNRLVSVIQRLCALCFFSEFLNLITNIEFNNCLYCLKEIITK